MSKLVLNPQYTLYYDELLKVLEDTYQEGFEAAEELQKHRELGERSIYKHDSRDEFLKITKDEYLDEVLNRDWEY